MAAGMEAKGWPGVAGSSALGHCRARARGSSVTVVLCGCLLVGSLTMLASCSPRASGELTLDPAVVESMTRYRKQYVIAAGDRLDVIVRGHPEVSRVSSESGQGVLVRADGYITLPVLNDVKAAGLTFPQFDAALTELFSKRLVDPEVTVIGTNLREPMVYVLGEVPSPKPVPFRLATTAAQAIAYAGGLKHSATKRAVALIRLTDEGRLRAYKIPVDVRGQPAPYMALHATLLQPDDLILVPETPIAQFDRWVNDYVNQPLQGINAVLAPITNFVLIRELMASDN